MVLCRYCRKNVKPKMYLTWKGFICGLGIFYLIYVMMKIPQCPNCNFPMPWGSMVFAFHPTQQLIKLARISVLQLILFKDGVMSISRRSDSSQHHISMNTYQAAYFNMMECGLKTTINLSEPTVKKGDLA